MNLRFWRQPAAAHVVLPAGCTAMLAVGASAAGLHGPAQPLPVMAWARAYGLIPCCGGSPHSVPLIGPGPAFDPDSP
jgi:hypothetical protein